MTTRDFEILLVEDNPGDARLTLEILKGAATGKRITHVRDGVEALAYLRREGDYTAATRPDLILLDLNLPRKDGREVLAVVKNDESLRRIPIVVLTSSEAEEDIFQVYDLKANCYIAKPVNFDQFQRVIQCLEEFWLTIVKLPSE